MYALGFSRNLRGLVISSANPVGRPVTIVRAVESRAALSNGANERAVLASRSEGNEATRHK